MTLYVKDPGDSLVLEFNFEDALESGVTIASVTHSVQTGLTKGAESNDTNSSLVEVSGGAHGSTYLVDALATLSTAEILKRQITLRVFRGS